MRGSALSSRGRDCNITASSGRDASKQSTLKTPRFIRSRERVPYLSLFLFLFFQFHVRATGRALFYCFSRAACALAQPPAFCITLRGNVPIGCLRAIRYF